MAQQAHRRKRRRPNTKRRPEASLLGDKIHTVEVAGGPSVPRAGRLRSPPFSAPASCFCRCLQLSNVLPRFRPLLVLRRFLLLKATGRGFKFRAWVAECAPYLGAEVLNSSSVVMVSEDFIDLGSDTVNEATELYIDNQTLQSIEHPDEANPDSDNLEKVEQHGRENDQQVVQSVLHDDDLIHQSVLQGSAELTECVTVVESVNIVGTGNKENGCTEFTAVKDHVSLKEELEHGEETYFPALYVGRDKSATVSFRVDKRARKEESDYIDSDLVPLYDRGYALGLTSSSRSTNSERVEPLEASRCFNCGSYSHSLKECPKPRDSVAISHARKQHSSKRNSISGSRNSTRYYQSSSGKYDDLKAGVLGAELRKCLGIGELDPPPWLHRMRELGYPPGYLDLEEDEDQPSGLTIYADEETGAEYEEGELPEKGEAEPPEKKMTVEFPGVNAPVPENADLRLWAASPSFPSSSDSFNSRSQHRSTHSETQRGNFPDPRHSWDYRENDLPGSDYGLGSSAPSHSPGYSPYDYRSPDLRRSLSDRGRGFAYHDGSPGHVLESSSPYTSGHSLSSAERHSRSFTTDHRAFESHYSASADDSLWKDRYSHRHHQRR
ncbi:hypothetical protein Taro_015303 [Colocasia esculenta]|uniref:CCHC-type domain-containing protein n=1 Tax=Colocasia esculenta TaxID=4460 RepID=A0A843UPI1_COLES|nr:hypothetical protein [Colocasia esculenta]